MKTVISKSRWIFLLLLAAAALAVSGCASTESDNQSARPWSTPQNWENGLPSGMYDQYR